MSELDKVSESELVLADALDDPGDLLAAGRNYHRLVLADVADDQDGLDAQGVPDGPDDLDG